MKLPLLDFLTQNFYNINERNEECTIEQYELELPKETDEIISTFTKKRFKKMVFDKTNPFEFGRDFDDVEAEFSFLPPRVDVKVVLVGDDTSKFKRAVVKELNSVFRQVYLCGQKYGGSRIYDSVVIELLEGLAEYCSAIMDIKTYKLGKDVILVDIINIIIDALIRFYSDRNNRNVIVDCCIDYLFDDMKRCRPDLGFIIDYYYNIDFISYQIDNPQNMSPLNSEIIECYKFYKDNLIWDDNEFYNDLLAELKTKILWYENAYLCSFFNVKILGRDVFDNKLDDKKYLEEKFEEIKKSSRFECEFLNRGASLDNCKKQAFYESKIPIDKSIFPFKDYSLFFKLHTYLDELSQKQIDISDANFEKAKQKLAFLNGEYKGHRFMSEEDYNKLEGYVKELIGGKCPKNVGTITMFENPEARSKNAWSYRYVCYPIAVIHDELFGKKNDKSKWIDLVAKLFEKDYVEAEKRFGTTKSMKPSNYNEIVKNVVF